MACVEKQTGEQCIRVCHFTNRINSVKEYDGDIGNYKSMLSG
jgi:hypothetical protein